ncbi:hypothetical protein D3C81_1724860 [compost metagenome]
MVQVIAVWPEMVVDHVYDHRQAQAVGAVDQLLERFGRAIGRLRGVGQHAVITPVALAGKLRQRHQLDCRDAQVHQARQLLLDCGEPAEQADV